LALILADTDVLIDYLMDKQPAADLVMEYRRSEALQTTVITCFELLSGVREGRKHGERVRTLIASIPVLPLVREAAIRAAAVRVDLDGRGKSIGMADSLIAGIALTNDLALLTRNRKHFEHIEDLSLVPIA
jgi:tRNA(fMet)-specific endonuclease VapC